MANTEIHVGDVGTIFELTIKDDDGVVDLTSGTVDIKIQDPGLNVDTKPGTIDGDPTTGIVRYTTVSGDIDEEGCWQIQAVVTLPGGTWSSDIQQFEVFPNL